VGLPLEDEKWGSLTKEERHERRNLVSRAAIDSHRAKKREEKYIDIRRREGVKGIVKKMFSIWDPA